HEMGLFAKLVAVVLAIMAVSSLTVFVERLWAFARARRRSLAFGAIAGQFLERHPHEELLRCSQEFRSSPLARMVGFAVKAYLQGVKRLGKVSPVELAKREVERKAETQAGR